VRATFLLGPAGSGKTHRCRAEIRAELSKLPQGSPLILLAPKQATFQLERQLLADGSLPGYTRLHILSFDRLAGFVFDRLERPFPELLSEEGRVMVLRALLGRRKDDLQLFRASARLPGFARQLSELLRELQRHHLTWAKLETLSQKVGPANRLDAKLHDLALVLHGYQEWLKKHRLQDADSLLDLATAELRSAVGAPDCPFVLAGLWLDGFAQMTPQERALLAALAPFCQRAMLAFCVDGEPAANMSWHSPWSVVSDTYQRCRDEFAALPGVQIEVELLERKPAAGRFARQPALQHLERWWAQPKPFQNGKAGVSPTESFAGGTPVPPPVRVVACVNPEGEAVFAAREILRYVRDEAGRFRNVAVLVRKLDDYHNALRRVFTRYQIPFFLDRREPVAHHPLAELTRYALRTVTFGWEHDDWFGALKTGLVLYDDAAIDRLENEALARGWQGKTWLEPIKIPGAPERQEWMERLRQKVVPPFQGFLDTLTGLQRRPTGSQLSAALRELWKELKVDRQLGKWSSATDPAPLRPAARAAIHETVWGQMDEWLKDVELAFSNEAMPLADWLPIVEAGLGNLSVGVIPPALDQVLVGTIDRSRNPDLQLALVLGVNEGAFPAPPTSPALLGKTDREALASHGAALGPDHHQQIGLERYYGYIACTRANERLAVTFARRDARGRSLNPSPFIDDLRRLFPGLEAEEFSGATDWRQAEHWNELVVSLLRSKAHASGPADALSSLFETVPFFKPVLEKWQQMAESRAVRRLSPALAESIYGNEMDTSVSGLEDFAACPFKFFASRGLRAEERAEFEADRREKGRFQHDLLKEFHKRVKALKRQWRDLSPQEARAVVRQAGEDLLPVFRDGLFLASESRRFAAGVLIEGLEKLIETLIGWAAQYQFDPAAVELSFGLKDSRLPAWRIELDGRHSLLLRGRIDRVDVCRIEETGETLGVIIDYKSSMRELDPVLLHHGLELQLLAYLGALSQLADLSEELDAGRLLPAGVFYVALKGGGGSAKTRDERDKARRAGYQHRGRFDGGRLEKFDNRRESKGDQFRYSKNKDGGFSKVGNEAMPTEEFRALLERVKEFLRRHGRAIYDGQVDVAPYRWRNETACDLCAYRAVCRFDPWIQPYRVLHPPSKKEDGPSAGKKTKPKTRE